MSNHVDQLGLRSQILVDWNHLIRPNHPLVLQTIPIFKYMTLLIARHDIWSFVSFKQNYITIVYFVVNYFIIKYTLSLTSSFCIYTKKMKTNDEQA